MLKFVAAGQGPGQQTRPSADAWERVFSYMCVGALARHRSRQERIAIAPGHCLWLVVRHVVLNVRFRGEIDSTC